MWVKVSLIVVVWFFSIVLNIFLVSYLDEKKLRFSEMLENEAFTFIVMCAFAPAVSIILILGAVAKIGVRISNGILGFGVKECDSCSHRCGNECLFFKLTLKPRMMCKGRFFSQ